MASLDDATRTQIRNIEQGTGRSMTAWVAMVRATGFTKHGEILAWLKSEHGFTHGNANLVTLTALRGDGAPDGDALVDAIYAGPKSPCARSTTRSSPWYAGSRRRGASPQADLRVAPAIEAVRDGRPGVRRSAGDRPEPQGHRAHWAAGVGRRDVHAPRAAGRTG